MTLKNFLAELSFIQIPAVKRHAKGLMIALEKSKRKEMLEYEVNWKDKIKEEEVECQECGQKKILTYRIKNGCTELIKERCEHCGFYWER